MLSLSELFSWIVLLVSYVKGHYQTQDDLDFILSFSCFVDLCFLFRPMLFSFPFIFIFSLKVFGFGFIDFSSDFYYFFSSAYLVFALPFLVYKGRSLDYSRSFFLIYAYNAINYPLSTAFAVTPKFWQITFLLAIISKYLKISLEISLIRVLLRSLLFNLYVFEGILPLSVLDF